MLTKLAKLNENLSVSLGVIASLVFLIGQSAQAIENGSSIPFSVAPSEVQVLNTHLDNDKEIGECTATKIADLTYITAAHCMILTPKGAGIIISQESGNPLEIVSEVANVTFSQAFPNYIQWQGVAPWNEGCDIGVFKVDRETLNIPKANVNLDKQKLDGRLVYLAGYGENETHEMIGNPLRGTVSIARPISSKVLFLSVDSKLKKAGEGYADHGDSGSGVMNAVLDPTTKQIVPGHNILAIISAGVPGEAGTWIRDATGLTVVATRLDQPRIQTWLHKILLQK